ncbi:hypothetical protein SALBM217S_03135 [Streptomyces griseoloalbus]
MASASSTVRLRLALAKDSVALANTATRRAPSASARSRPRSLGTSTGRSTGRSDTAGNRSSASASCGTHFGCTKLVASIVVRPVPASRRTNSAFTAVGTVCFSFCRPSRAPTSWIRTRAGSPSAGTAMGRPSSLAFMPSPLPRSPQVPRSPPAR